MPKVKFLKELSLTDNCIIRTISSFAINEELAMIADFYNVDILRLKSDYNAVIMNYLKSEVNRLISVFDFEIACLRSVRIFNVLFIFSGLMFV